LVLVQLTAVRDNVSNLVKLRQYLLHSLLTPQGVGEINPVVVENAYQFSEVSIRERIVGTDRHRCIAFLFLLLLNLTLQGLSHLAFPPPSTVLFGQSLRYETADGIF